MSWHEQKVHDRTIEALLISLAGGTALGYGLATPSFTSSAIGATIALALVVVSAWYLPPAETIARQWENRQLMEGDDD